MPNIVIYVFFKKLIIKTEHKGMGASQGTSNYQSKVVDIFGMTISFEFIYISIFLMKGP